MALADKALSFSMSDFYCANLIANLSLQSDAITYSLGLYSHIYPNKHFPLVRKPASPQRISRSGLDMS
jgi:hypothetical protein